MEKELTLQEKEERWISALKRKEKCRTMEEWDFEVMSEVLYEDDEFIFWKECIGTYTFKKKKTEKVWLPNWIYFLKVKKLKDRKL